MIITFEICSKHKISRQIKYMNKITKIKITKEEYKNISKYTAIPIGIVFLEEKKGCYLQGNKEDFEKLLDRLSNYFVEHGIDKKEEINAIGYNII